MNKGYIKVMHDIRSCEGQVAEVNPKFNTNQLCDVKTDNAVLNCVHPLAVSLELNSYTIYYTD